MHVPDVPERHVTELARLLPQGPHPDGAPPQVVAQRTTHQARLYAERLWTEAWTAGAWAASQAISGGSPGRLIVMPGGAQAEVPEHLRPVVAAGAFEGISLGELSDALSVAGRVYRPGGSWGLTVVREGVQPPDASGRRPDAELVAVVVNGDRELAKRICAGLNGQTAGDQ